MKNHEMIWWPDTGDFLDVTYPKTGRGIVQSKWWAPASGATNRSRWSTFRHGKLGKMSLPELLFRDPCKFFGLSLGSYSDIKINDFEFGEIYSKIRAIRIPKCAPVGSRVVHKWADDRYEGFRLTARPLEYVRQRGTCLVEDHLDLTHQLTHFGRSIDVVAVSSLVRVLETGAPGTWNRKKCEAFFQDDSNFLFRTDGAGKIAKSL
jgi:hypothetical protein